jgi:tol-pal system protein YbgF
VEGRKTFLPAVLMRRSFSLAVSFAVAAWSSQVFADAASGLAAYKAGDYPVALRELTPAAQAGDAEASYVLGIIYEQGLGVPASDLEAVKLYQAAAARGHAGAQYMLGVHQQIGLGTPINLIEAYKWLLLAERGGVPAAREFLGSFAGRMSAEDIARATSSADALCASGSAACRTTQTSVAPPPPLPAPAPAAVPEPPVKASPPQAAVAPEPFSGTFVVMRQTQLLDKPSSRGKRITLLHQWERVVASARDSTGWIRVTAQGKDGWVAAANIRDEKAAEDAEWSRVNLNDVASLTAFIAHFPQGSHSVEASTKLSARREQLARTELPEQNKPPPVVARNVRKKPVDEVAATSSLNRAETQSSPGPDDLAGSAPLPVSPPPPAIVSTPIADLSEQAKKPGADAKKMPTRLYPQSPSPASGPEVAQLEQNQIGTIPDQTLMTGKPIDLYNQALSLINEGDFASAETALRQILASYASDPVAQNAEYHLADIYLRQGDFPKAATAFQKFRSTYPRSANDPLALLNYATSLGRLGDKGAACKAFKDLGVQYPGLSGEAKEKKISEMRQAGCG